MIWFGSVDFATISLLNLSGQRCMEVRKNMHYPCLKCHENEEKFENYHVLRNDHNKIIRIKTTQPISMILVSFFSEDNVLSDKIKICYIFEYQSNENRAFHFFLDTRYTKRRCYEKHGQI